MYFFIECNTSGLCPGVHQEDSKGVPPLVVVRGSYPARRNTFGKYIFYCSLTAESQGTFEIPLKLARYFYEEANLSDYPLGMLGTGDRDRLHAAFRRGGGCPTQRVFNLFFMS